MRRTDMKKTIFIILLVLSLITSVYALVIPHAFYGTAKYSDNSLVPDGTVITAKLNGNAVDTSTVQNGKYGYGDDTLIVTDDFEQGGTVTFHIGAVDAEQEVTFQSGNATNLDLTFPEPHRHRKPLLLKRIILEVTLIPIPEEKHQEITAEVLVLETALAVEDLQVAEVEAVAHLQRKQQ